MRLPRALPNQKIAQSTCLLYFISIPKKQKGASFEAPSYFPKVTVQLLHCFLTVHDADLVVDGFVVDGF